MNIADLASRTTNVADKKKNWVKSAHLKKGAFTAQADKAGKSVHEFAEEERRSGTPASVLVSL